MHSTAKRLAAIDATLTLIAVIAASRIRLSQTDWDTVVSVEGAFRVVVLVGVMLACFAVAGLYDARRVSQHRDRIVRIVTALGCASFIMAISYYCWPNLMIGRGVFMTSALIACLLVSASSLVRSSMDRRSGGVSEESRAAVPSR